MLRPTESVILLILLFFVQRPHLGALCPVRPCQKSALNALKFKRTAKQQQASADTSSASSSSSWPAQQPANDLPPAQSRDGTVSSRYFSATPPSAGNILVPSSSPLLSDSSHLQHRAAHDNGSDDTIPGLHHTDMGRPPPRPFVDDPLTAPSGFIIGNSTASSSSGYSRGIRDDRSTEPQEGRDGERPLKRQNRGQSPPSPDPLNVLDTPDSPEIVRPGQRRKPNGAVPMSIVSSDDSFSEASKDAGPSRPRLIRGPRTVPQTPPTPQSDAAATRFRISHPEHDPTRAQAAWQEAGGDVARATALLNDSSWQPHRPSNIATVKTPQKSVESGRVKELEDATKAGRAALREKGKKSMIYAKSALPTTTPPASKAIPNTTKPAPATPVRPPTPDSPEVSLPQPKRLKRKIIDSDSEPDFDDSEDDRHSSDAEDANEQQAYDYFNSASSEALQELTGAYVLYAPTHMLTECYQRLQCCPSQ